MPHGQAGHPARRFGAPPLSRLRLTNPGRQAATAPLLAAAGGLALLVAHPPLGWWPATFLGPALLLAAIDTDARAARASGRPMRAGRLGLWCGVVVFAPMLTWVVLPAGYLGWALLAGIQAGWMGLLGLLLGRVVDRWWLAPAAAVAWTGIDAWRSIVPLNGFEWGAIAYAHVDGSWLLPVARLVGGRGITLLVVLISALAFQVVRDTARALAERDGATVEDALRSTRLPVAALVAALLASVLATIEPPAQTGTMDVLAVQGNDIRHWEEPEPDPAGRILSSLSDLTHDALADQPDVDLVVWPESSIEPDPGSDRGADVRPVIDEAASAAGNLLAGTTLDGPEPAENRYVAASLYEDGFDETDRYVKHRLVPFGEYVPARPLLAWFPPLDQVPRDALPGPRGQTVDVNGVRTAVVICFETLFTGVTRDNVLDRGEPADLLIVITNNASFGDSAQPWQHLAQTRLRAVETGRWAVHGAISGTSAFVDPDGRTYQETDLYTLATIRQQVGLVEGSTPYLVIGDVVGVGSRLAVAGGLVALLGMGVVGRRRRTRQVGGAPASPDGRREPVG